MGWLLVVVGSELKEGVLTSEHLLVVGSELKEGVLTSEHLLVVVGRSTD